MPATRQLRCRNMMKPARLRSLQHVGHCFRISAVPGNQCVREGLRLYPAISTSNWGTHVKRGAAAGRPRRFPSFSSSFSWTRRQSERGRQDLARANEELSRAESTLQRRAPHLHAPRLSAKDKARASRSGRSGRRARKRFGSERRCLWLRKDSLAGVGTGAGCRKGFAGEGQSDVWICAHHRSVRRSRH